MAITPAQKQTALQVAAVVAASVSENGTVPSQKVLRQCCVTGLKLTTQMDELVAACNETPEILDVSLDAGGYQKISEHLQARAERKATEAPETKAADTPPEGGTETPPEGGTTEADTAKGKGKK